MFASFLLSSAAAASSLTLLLHDPGAREGPSEGCDVALCTSLLERIEAAERRVDLAVYGLRGQPVLLGALERARARGVSVRVVVDADVHGAHTYDDTAALLALVAPHHATDAASDRRAAAERRRLDLPDRCERPPGFRGPLQCLVYDLGDRCLFARYASREPIVFEGHIMHHKFAVVDERHVWTGSTNLSDSGTGGYNANLAVLVDSPRVAAWYTAEFEELYAGRFHHDKRPGAPRTARLADGTVVSVWFSPQDRPLTRAVRPLVAGARRSVDVAAFFLTHSELARDLIEAHRRGVRIRVLLDATGAANEYSKHEVLRAAGIPVKVDDLGGKMHAKTLLVDGRILVAGSMNLTSAGEGGNDENTLVIEQAAAAADWQRWFEGLWASVDDRWLHAQPDPESRDSRSACRDGMDNDHDGRVDAADPGCSANPPPLPARPPQDVVRKPYGGCVAPWSPGNR